MKFHPQLLLAVAFAYVLATASLADAEHNKTVAEFKEVHHTNRQHPSSVRRYPNEIHLCSGTFIRDTVLVTTARCIIGEIPEEISVYYGAKNLTDGGHLVKARRLVPHPNYEPFPQKNNIGLIITESPVQNINAYSLPNFWPDFTGKASVYQWGFKTVEQLRFAPSPKVVTLVSPSKCSVFLREYIDCNHICGRSESLRHGRFDQGVPLTGFIANVSYMIALYNRPFRSKTPNVDRYELVFPYRSWIEEVIEESS